VDSAADLKTQLSSAELKNKRLMEVFKKTSQELRDVTYQLLGYRIDMVVPSQYKLVHIYADSADECFLFKVSIME